MVRALGLAGLECALVARPDNPARYSRFVTEVIDIDRPDLLDAMLAYAAARDDKPVLYLQEDAGLQLALEHRDELDAAFHLPLARTELVRVLLDKPRFQAFAERLRLRVPRALRVSDAAPGALAGLRPPLIVKPALRDEHWLAESNGAKALAVDDEEAWARMHPKLAGLGVDLLVQEQVPGGEDRVESYHAYVDRSGRTLGEFTGRKLRTWPSSFGGSTALVTTDRADVREAGRALLARIGLTGPAKVDFKRGADDTLWLLEINPRFTLWEHLGAVAGVNLPALAHADLSGRDPEPAPPARAGVTWCHPRMDVAAVRSSGGSLMRWASFALRSEARSGAHVDDPLPMLAGKLWPRLVGSNRAH